MEQFHRYAVYYAPDRGPFARFAAEWLGWCPLSGIEKPHPDVAGLPRPVEEITRTPRKYGFHGTIKPPFRLADGSSPEALQDDLSALARRLTPVRMGGLALKRLGGFVALVPEGDTSALAQLAGEVVEALDHHRAPAPASEIQRRRAAGLTPRQDELLMRWGYPYVMDEFRFHLTLTGKLDPDEAARTMAALDPYLTPLLPRPFALRDLCLFGEDETGRFQLIQRYALTG
ncbi:putative phosphonate metabolism protein [Maritimibacter alkaliphilus HTCC2654]|uniref:Phosphonate metabolism protein n=1 Tax=Maritimibacter alkaliphilus HTCC2654 TaxID=314271 RepID=A3VEJ9_9RHOB|nr:DUF1045 domain-containing protein [Maritimibacter alkaliphilus]EAQ13337.1 hypothetical protein RB2654_09714 [Rhodobacterales bacterium HTCC2654] [Maritimibacter alkaliphilus HTCC2654]TYP85244.1 putative phosphonate metabolism protein [Maritimibacter alkaliphilus HTCC2654]